MQHFCNTKDVKKGRAIVQKHVVPPEVLESMWQLFLKTSVPRLIAEHKKQKEEEAKKKGTDNAETERRTFN
ncbi:hypothetical protein ACTL32_09525 [Planococcus sp. FY231025]|uniref:hypothetical protein n=1 Tax=Planococcus sp. FY231025 TaxID=3455699 RepID=UPI003F93F406